MQHATLPKLYRRNPSHLRQIKHLRDRRPNLPRLRVGARLARQYQVERYAPYRRGQSTRGRQRIRARQRAITQVLVSNGDTTVIGGIYVSSEQTEQDRTPGLNRIPLLGWLFRRDSIRDDSRELLIFITPRILTL